MRTGDLRIADIEDVRDCPTWAVKCPPMDDAKHATAGSRATGGALVDLEWAEKMIAGQKAIGVAMSQAAGRHFYARFDCHRLAGKSARSAVKAALDDMNRDPVLTASGGCD
jgi:hypothetical protein